MAYAIMRIQKHKSCGSLSAAERHGKNRERLKHLSHPERSHENLVYKKYKDLTLVQSWKKETEGMKIRKNAVFAIEIVLTFSPEVRTEMETQLNEWTKANMDWVSNEFGKDNILQAQIEFDESNLHQHIFVIPKIGDRLSSREFIGGREKLTNLQTTYAKAVENFGLERGKCYINTPKEEKPRHKSLAQYYYEVEHERGTESVIIDIQKRLKRNNREER